MKVEVWDDGRARRQKGDWVCTRPFPSMPVGFWNDADASVTEPISRAIHVCATATIAS